VFCFVPSGTLINSTQLCEVKMTDNLLILFHQFDEVSPPMNTVANQFDNYDEKNISDVVKCLLDEMTDDLTKFDTTGRQSCHSSSVAGLELLLMDE